MLYIASFNINDSLRFFCGSCGWGSLIFSDGKAAHSSWPNTSIFCKLSCMNYMFEIFPNWLNYVEVRRPRWPLPEPSLLSAVTKERSTWPCVLVHCHFGMSECIPCAASCLMSANFPPVFSENTLHSPCHQFWPIAWVAHTSPKHQWSTSVFHSRHGVLSSYALLTLL